MTSTRKRSQIPIAFSAPQISWLRAQAQVRGTSVADIVRRCVDIRMIGPLGNVRVPDDVQTMGDLRQAFPEAFLEVPDNTPVRLVEKE